MPQDTSACGVCDPADWIARAAREHPQRVFLRTPAGRALSYAALQTQTAQFAAALAQHGVLAGDRIAVRIEKSVEAVLLYIACLRLGAVFVPVNVAGTPRSSSSCCAIRSRASPYCPRGILKP